jgi:hypothetical protein
MQQQEKALRVLFLQRRCGLMLEWRDGIFKKGKDYCRDTRMQRKHHE